MTEIELLPASPQAEAHDEQGGSTKTEGNSQSIDHLFDLTTLAPTAPDLTFTALERMSYQPAHRLPNVPSLSLDLGPTDLSVTFDELRNPPTAQPAQPASATSPTDPKSTQLALECDPRDGSRRWASLAEFGRSVMRGQEQKANSLYHRPTFGSPSHLKRRISDIRSSAPSLISSTRHRTSLFRPWSHQNSLPGSPDTDPSADTFPTLPPMSELLDGRSFEEDDEVLSPVTSPAAEAGLTTTSTDKTLPTSAADTLMLPTDHRHSHRAASLISSKSQPVMPTNSLSQALALEANPDGPQRSSMTELDNKAAETCQQAKLSWRKPASLLKHIVKGFSCKSPPRST